MARAVPILPADDLAAARTFYVEKLGFQVEWLASDDGRTGLMGVTRDGIALTIDAPMSGHGRQACVSLRVESADAYHAEWRDKLAGIAPVIEEPGVAVTSLAEALAHYAGIE